MQLLAVTAEGVKVGAGAKTKLKSLDGAKNTVRNRLGRIMLFSANYAFRIAKKLPSYAFYAPQVV